MKKFHSELLFALKISSDVNQKDFLCGMLDFDHVWAENYDSKRSMLLHK